MSYAVILFPSVHHAIRAEKKTRENGFSVKLIPVPRHLSSDCGVCLRCSLEQREPLELLLKEAGVKMEGVHPLE